MSVKELIKALQVTKISVYYTQADDDATLPYMVVNDYAERYDSADNGIDDKRVSVQVDYYTKEPFDNNKDIILNTFSYNGIIPRYSRYYLEDEKVYQHIFDVEIR